MKPNNLDPLRRARGWLRGAVLLVSIALGGCQSPYQALQALAVQHRQQLQVIPSQPFPLVASTPLENLDTSRIRVYLEGDGYAWVTSSRPSLDPSPRRLLVANLAFNDPLPSVYLARPCQFVSTSGCQADIWTDRRFSREVLASLDQALTQIKNRNGNQSFELIGYSGGAALALLLAAQRDDIDQVQTLAGNLTPREWVKLHKLSPLQGSLEPLDQRARLKHLPQRHFLGSNDQIVPPFLFQRYRAALGDAACLRHVVLPGVTHEDGWLQGWAVWRSQSVDCDGH